MSNITIGIDASRANYDKKTGVELYCFHLLQKLKETQNSKFKNQKFRVVLYSNKSLTGDLANLPENWESKVLKWPPGRLWTQIRLSWEMLVNPPDVLFIPAHVFPIIHPKKTVMMAHDVAALKFPESYSWFERWYSTWSAQSAVRKLWKVIVPSEFTKSELMKKGKGGKKNVFVVHHGYDQRYRQLADQTRVQAVLSKYGIRQPFLLSVGRLEEKKNTVRIIEAFNQLNYSLKPNTFHLILVGNPGYGYEKVKAAVGVSPYKDFIIMPGYVNPDSLVDIMNAAEAFVFPSLYEGFGLPLLEAMACGTSAVASRGSSLEEVGGEACVYVDPLDVNDITRGILEVLSSAEARENRRKIGLELVKKFSWQKSAAETLGVLIDK